MESRGPSSVYDYPQADAVAQPELARAVSRYRALPVAYADKADVPLLYWLLGQGTNALKMDAFEALYGDPPPGSTQRCENCSSAYQQVTSGMLICSQISGYIEPQLWCRLWNEDRN